MNRLRGSDYDPFTMVDTRMGPWGRARSRLAHRLTRAYVVSFPKSGRTWLRMLLAHYFAEVYGVRVDPEITDQWRRNPRIPATRFTHLGSDKPMRRECSFDFLRYRDKRVVYLYRDPRDVTLSYYFHVNKRWGKTPNELKEIGDFIRDERYGIARVVGFMNLVADNLRHWPRVKRVSYEALHHDGKGVLTEVLRHIDRRAVDADLVREAVRACSFSRMRRMEAEGEVRHDSLQPGDGADPQSFKVREGRIGAHRRHLSTEDLAFVNRYTKSHLNPIYDDYIRGVADQETTADDATGR